jgi:hypothetical protein
MKLICTLLVLATASASWSVLGGSADTAYPGHGCLQDYIRKTHNSVATLGDCQALCEARSTCMSISYKTDNSQCLLHDGNFVQDLMGVNSIATFSSRADCRYYEYTRPPTALSVSFLLGGSDSAYPGYGCLSNRNSETLAGLTLEECRAACDARSTCKSIDYQNDGTSAMKCDLSDGTILLAENGDSNPGTFNTNNKCYYYEYTRPSPTCSMTCTLDSATKVVSAIHDATTGHAFHRCYHDDTVSATHCACQCSDTAY